MADLNTAQKAPLVVVSATGSELNPNAYTATVTGTAVHIQNQGGGEGTDYVVADEPGTALIEVTSVYGIGSFSVTVEMAPLALSLGAVEPK